MWGDIRGREPSTGARGPSAALDGAAAGRHSLGLGKAAVEMDVKGGPSRAIRDPAADHPAGRLTSVLTERRRPRLWPPPAPAPPSPGRRALLSPSSFLGPGSGL